MSRILAGSARLASRADLPVQVAAVCYRQNGSSVEFLLVKTSAGKWTFPKGRLNPSMSASESAAREAWEEAGARGRIGENHFGSYVDTKRALAHDAAGTREVHILTYLLEVRSAVAPQENGRCPTWYDGDEAKKRLAEGRASSYAGPIAKIIDAAMDYLNNQQRKRSNLLVRTQGSRFAQAR